MELAPLEWSEPYIAGYETIEAQDGEITWRIVDVPRDVVRISCNGYDEEGYYVRSDEMNIYGESVTEAKMIVEMLRNGSDHLAGWQEQLEAEGLVRTYPNAESNLSNLWNDDRKTGRFTINVTQDTGDFGQNNNVHATYESGRSNFWHNVSSLSAPRTNPYKAASIMMKSGLPKPVDTLKMGVAIALAVRRARIARGGSFAKPLV